MCIRDRCTGFFCLAIIKGPPNDNYFIIEGPCLDYFTEKVPQTHFCAAGLAAMQRTALCKQLRSCLLYTSVLNPLPDVSVMLPCPNDPAAGTLFLCDESGVEVPMTGYDDTAKAASFQISHTGTYTIVGKEDTASLAHVADTEHSWPPIFFLIAACLLLLSAGVFFLKRRRK